MKTKIIADSSCDIYQIDGVDFEAVPLTIFTKQRSFTDNKELDVKNMLDCLTLNRGRTYTACPNLNAWLNSFDDADIIYVVTLSGSISNTYSTAVAASRLYCGNHPDAKVHIFNTLSAGPQVRLLAEKIAEYVKQGRGYDEICSMGEDYLRHTRGFFAMESFHNLVQNGRVNKAVASLAGLLGIKIITTASKGGKIELVKKCRGETGVLKSFMDSIENAGFNGGKLYIANCMNNALSKRIAQSVKHRFPSAEIAVYRAGGLCSYYAERGGIMIGFESGIEYLQNLGNIR